MGKMCRERWTRKESMKKEGKYEKGREIGKRGKSRQPENQIGRENN